MRFVTLIYCMVCVPAVANSGGCGDRPQQVSPATKPALMTSSTTPTPAWESEVGRVITVEGVAQPRKGGAAMVVDGGGYLWIDDFHFWPGGLDGTRVRVTGTLIERNDLPVFIHKPPEPGDDVFSDAVQGIPMPPGTDLKAASHRYLLRDARVEPIRP